MSNSEDASRRRRTARLMLAPWRGSAVRSRRCSPP